MIDNFYINLSDLACMPVRSISTTSGFSNSSCDVYEDLDIEVTVRCEPASDDDLPFCDMNCDCCDELECEFENEDDIPMWGIPDVRKVIFNPPATIVFWEDDTKTIVKCMEGQPFEKYAGFCAACMKKMFGSTSRAKAIMDECDQDTWKRLVEEEKAIRKSVPKKSEPKPKTISVDELIEAFADAIKNTVTAKAEEKENQNETPAE